MLPDNKQAIDPITFFEYDKISDDVCFLGQNATVRFSVSLSNKNNINKQRASFHKEFKYKSKDTGQDLITIRRNFDYFLSIENMTKPDNCDKAYIRIGPREYFLLKDALDEVRSWFNSDKYKNLYAYVNNKLRIVGPAPSRRVIGLPMGKYIDFEATILDKYDDSQEAGISVYLSDKNNSFDMSLDTFMGFYYIYQNFNMFQSAQLMLNYIERPEYGFNMTSFDTGRTYSPSNENNVPTGKTIMGRKIQSKALD